MREPLNTPDDAPYDRPQQAWRCGLSHDGPACPLGPSLRGKCPGAAACHPVREGDRWRCNRSGLRGGPCADGPDPEGQCAVAYRCTPFRSLRSKRGRFAGGVALAAVGALLVLLSADSQTEAIAPGPLSVHHAQLVAGENASQRCAACHAAGAATLAQWVGHVTGAAMLAPVQPALCLDCHQKTLDPAWATAAHTMDPAALAASPLAERRRDPSEPVACRACHREHQGRLHDLTAIADARCQACHETQCESLSTDHPEFVDWPHRRRTAIAFDHGAHQGKHYPDEQREFACALCHAVDPVGQRMATFGYDVACRECHDKSIAASTAAGIAVLTVPTLDLESLADAGLDVGEWPDAATGDFDGPLSPAVKLLLAADPDGAAALATLSARFDFYDVEFDDEQQLAAAAQAVAAYKRVLARVAIGDEETGRLFPGLAPDAVQTWLDQYLPGVAALVDAEQGEAPGEPRRGDLRRPPGLAGAASSRATGPTGRWESDATTLALRYRPAGHGDALLTAWLDELARAATGESASVADPLLRDLVRPTAPGQCALCHSLERLPSGELAMQWRARRSAAPHRAPGDDQREPPGTADAAAAAPRGGRSARLQSPATLLPGVDARLASLTHFAHGPHLTQPQLADCDRCHRVVAGADVMLSYAHDDPHAFTAGFESLAKADCAACHRPQAAGDNCTQCHRYHGSQ